MASFHALVLLAVTVLTSLSTSSVHCHSFEKALLKWGVIVLVSSFSNFLQHPKPTYIHPRHHNHPAPIRACEWQPHFPAAPDSVVAASVPREPTAGGRSIEGALIITNHLPGREPWHIFITVVIKAISDYHQDIKLSRHLEQADYSTWWDLERTQSFRRNFSRKFSRKHTACSIMIHAVRVFQRC